jgi:peptidoglycan hydrolase-like protein with peptidoglycan-binding domain
VRYLQQKLSDFGYWITPDGVFGASTESTVRSFQNSKSLTVDGIVGATTWAALER